MVLSVFQEANGRAQFPNGPRHHVAWIDWKRIEIGVIASRDKVLKEENDDVAFFSLSKKNAPSSKAITPLAIVASIQRIHHLAVQTPVHEIFYVLRKIGEKERHPYGRTGSADPVLGKVSRCDDSKQIEIASAFKPELLV